MVTKVGSAGQVVESVIQYPQGSGKQNDNQTNENAKAQTVSARQNKIAERAQKKEAAAKASLEAAAAAPDNEIQVSTADRVNLELSSAAVKITVDDVNEKLKPIKSTVEFEYHEKTGRYSFKILDEEGKILKEVPPKKSLDMVAKLFELAGILVDEKL